MVTVSEFESILGDFRGPGGDQFSASTRPGRAKESKKATQSSDHVCAKNAVNSSVLARSQYYRFGVKSGPRGPKK